MRHQTMDATDEMVANPPADTETPQDGPHDGPSSARLLSKNAQKKLARAARMIEQKKERRAAEKERKKERKRIQAQKRAAGELDEENGADSRAGKRRRVDEQKGLRKPFAARVVVDLGFDDMMTENEIKSLTSQLAFTYSANRKAVHPFASLLFTSLNGRTFTRLESISHAAYKRWVDTCWWTEGYERLWEGQKADNGDADGEQTKEEVYKVGADTQVDEDAGAVEAEGESRVINEQDMPETRKKGGRAKPAKKPQTADRETVVYLTADSSEELTELTEGETYIIGGICDHNRYKNLCLNKSVTSNTRSARLPIGTYLSTLRTRKVLTVNQTFEILLKWVETRDWEKALSDVVPKRKFEKKGNGRKGDDADNEYEESDADGAEEGGDEVMIDAQAMEEADGDTRAGGDADEMASDKNVLTAIAS